jgi:hypothetical protein
MPDRLAFIDPDTGKVEVIENYACREPGPVTFSIQAAGSTTGLGAQVRGFMAQKDLAALAGHADPIYELYRHALEAAATTLSRNCGPKPKYAEQEAQAFAMFSERAANGGDINDTRFKDHVASTVGHPGNRLAGRKWVERVIAEWEDSQT